MLTVGQKRETGMIGLHTDVGQIRVRLPVAWPEFTVAEARQAIAWSPSLIHHHIVATGLSSGRTLLLNLSQSSLSPTLSATNPIQLNVRHSRPVTALSFSTLDPTYLATGLERHRSDYSLLIWDLSTANSSLPPDTDNVWQRPYDRLEPTHSLGRDTGEIRNIQHYCPAEHINSVAFVPNTIHSLLASANNKTIRLYDLRVPGPGSTPRDTSSDKGVVSYWGTRAVNGLTPDPAEEGRFASWESTPGGSVVRVWDTRRPSSELLSFDVPGAVVGLDWLDRGRLGVGTKEGLNVWEVVNNRNERKDGTTIGGVRTG